MTTFNIQSGTIPAGLTASRAKYAIANGGFTSITPLMMTYSYPIGMVDIGPLILIEGSVKSNIKPGSIIQLRRGEYNKEYTIGKIREINISSVIYSFMTIQVPPEGIPSLYDFSDPDTWTPYNDVYLNFSTEVNLVEKFPDLVNFFSVKMISDIGSFSVNVSWELSHKASTTRLRYREITTANNSTEWIYVSTEIDSLSKKISGFNYNTSYEIEILASDDPQFRGLSQYSNTQYFIYHN